MIIALDLAPWLLKRESRFEFSMWCNINHTDVIVCSSNQTWVITPVWLYVLKGSKRASTNIQTRALSPKDGAGTFIVGEVEKTLLLTIQSPQRSLSLSALISVVWKRLKSGLQSSAESCALSWAHLRVCSPLSAGHLPQTLQKQSC